MSNPLSGIPDPEPRRPVSRRFQPSPVREALGEMKDALRTRLRRMQPAFQRLQYRGKDAGRRTQRYVQDLWVLGKRNPRSLGIVGGAAGLALVAAYAVNATMNNSLCPPVRAGKAAKFLVLMDSVPQASAGSRLEIQYEVCGLASGTPYRGKLRLVQQQPQLAGKKKSSKSKPTVVTFKGRADGSATQRQQPVSLATTKPGSYTLELIVADDRGRERKRSQKITVRR